MSSSSTPPTPPASNRARSAGPVYFGWYIAFAGTLLTLLTVGARLSIGPFFLPMAHDIALSRSELSGVIAAGMLAYGLAMPLAGYLVATYGTRRVLLLGTLIMALSIAGTVTATSGTGLLLSFGIGLSVGLAFTSPVALTRVLSLWFVRQRGLAMFVLSAGSMAGIALLTPVFSWAIEIAGWRETLIGFAVIFALVCVPSALFIIHENVPPGADTRPDTPRAAASRAQGRQGGSHDAGVAATPAISMRDALRTRPFWLLTLGLFACGFSMNLLGTHAVPMLMDHGFGPQTSAFGISLIGLVAIFSSVALGKLSDRVPRRNVLALIYAVRGLGFLGLVEAASSWQLYTVAIIGGVVWAGSVAISSALMADIYGTRLVGILFGWAYVGHQLGGTLSAWMGGWAYEAFGTHLISFGAAGVLLFCAAAIALRLPDVGAHRASGLALARKQG